MSPQLGKRTRIREFGRWLGPWYIGPVSWIGEDDVLVEQDYWLRRYMEKSHCDTPGCCEMRSITHGPAVSNIRPVDMEW